MLRREQCIRVKRALFSNYSFCWLLCFVNVDPMSAVNKEISFRRDDTLLKRKGLSSPQSFLVSLWQKAYSPVLANASI